MEGFAKLKYYIAYERRNMHTSYRKVNAYGI